MTTHRAAAAARTERVIVEADGGSRGNPGDAAYGAVLKDAATGAVIAEAAEAIGKAEARHTRYGRLALWLIAITLIYIAVRIS